MITRKSFLITTLCLIMLLVPQTNTLRIHNKQTAHDYLVNTGNAHNLVGSHQQDQKKVYDEQRYLVDLAQKQNAFKQRITEIQNDFAGINMMLNDTGLSQEEKRIKLTQALADQRDSLITAQTQLNLPYELKSCQCLNLTEQKRNQLSQQLDKIKAKITDLQSSSVQSNKHCQSHDCPLINQLNTEIQMMKSYQTIMQNTINSKCCQVVKYQYRDNLDSSNWHWGNTTQSAYQAKLYQIEQTKDLKLQPCPINVPWVKDDNTCFPCPADKPLFNVGTRNCEKDCGVQAKNDAFVLNLTTHVCGYNTNCPQGQYFDESLKKCSITPSYYNQSSCPPQRPFWDPLSYSCQSCPSSTPYFDVILKKCRQCNANETWNSNTRSCDSSQSCGDGFYFDTQQNKCVATSKDTHSLCPPQRPYWNELTYSCDECTSDKPFYDTVKKVCRVCSDQQTFNEYTKQCVTQTQNVTCGVDEFYNNQTKSCEKRGTTSMCPPSTPYWDSVNFKCLQCPAYKPLFNQKTRQCEPCPLNHEWSTKYQSCVQNCPYGEEWNQQYKKCIKINRNCSQKFTFSFDLNQCIEINCDERNPFWNSTANLCQPCPAGTIYNYISTKCQKDARSGNVSVCLEDRPVWNPEYMRCQPCPEGKTWNPSTAACVSSTINSTSTMHHLLFSEGISQKSHKSKYIHGKVYGNSQVMYQHRDLGNFNA